ncbi:alpha/beta fold hydrolase [Nonomuraea antimicrobica]|uniref:Alpha/beta fold hydrolase n=1 Tax=Nonomuraea antimicrobica TaxID=561173 RepID=A0ABP7C867_9ACTN
MPPDSIVFGAAGFIGRCLVAELLRRGRADEAAVRGDGDRLTAWLTGQGVPLDGLSVVRADITRPGLGLPATGLDDVRDVHNCAARFAFGLSVAEARAANVTGALNVLDWAADLKSLRRVVHLSGYRVSGPGGGPPDYRGLGAYEASKKEGDAAVRARARERGIPLTIANPATAIGQGQFLGLASVVSDLWHGRLPAVPGGREVFVPVVDVGYLAAFLAALPGDERTEGQAYWILDDRTPVLPDLLELLATHMGVRAPRRTIPVGLLRRLPRALTGADPETLSFLSTDRYDTAPADAFAERIGLRRPPIEPTLRAWADDLVAARFGAIAAPPRPYGYQQVAGTATWVTGERVRPAHVLLYGLPLDSGSWAQVADRLDGPVLAADLPGLGGSGPGHRPLEEWLADLLRSAETRPVLVAHSLACGPAIRFAAAHPERLARLVLFAPAVLQAPSPWPLRSGGAAAVLRRTPPARLARLLGLPEGAVAAPFSRPGQARRAVAALRALHADRHDLRRALDGLDVPVELVAGSADPLTVAVDRPVTTIDGAGHYPQLTHPEAVAAAITVRAGKGQAAV